MAGFGAGMLLDTMPGGNALAGFAAEAAGEDDRYEGASDDEVAGAISAWDRVEAYAWRVSTRRWRSSSASGKIAIVIGVTSARSPPSDAGPTDTGLLPRAVPRHRPQPGRPSLHCAITGLPNRQGQQSSDSGNGARWSKAIARGTLPDRQRGYQSWLWISLQLSPSLYPT